MTPNQTISSLCMGGDWACAHGDFAGLREVAHQLGSYVPDVRQQAEAVVNACRSDIDHASALWVDLAAIVRA